MSTPTSIDPPDEARPQRWRFAARATLASLAVGAALLAVPAAAAAQTGPGGGGGFPGAGGPFASGSVVSVSGTTVNLKPVTDQASSDDVTVTLTDTTKYEKTQDAGTDAIQVGDCVRVNGTGSAKKGIKAETIALSDASSDGCGGGAPGGGGFPGGGNGQTPPSFPSGNGNGNGQTPPSFPNGNGNGNGNGTTRPRLDAGGTAFGTVKSVSGDDLVVKSTTFTIPKKQGAQPKSKKQDVKVTMSSSTKVTETVSGAASDVAAGKCVTASGTGDSGAITADSVRISDPDADGACGGPAFAGGGPGGAAPPTSGSD